MKRVAIFLAMVAAAPRVALAQVPPSPANPDAAPPGPAAPAAAPAPSPTPPPPAAPVEAAPAPAPPGDQYYVEGPPGSPPPFEPPVPGGAPFEPPAPPEERHLTPRSSISLGARLGWFFPFGNLWARGVPTTDAGRYYYVLDGVPWSDYASSGPMFEIDAGVRLGRSYTVFALWERAETGSGNFEDGFDGKQARGDTDFWAIGLRASSNPDRLGFLTEVAIGYRRARTLFENGAEYQFTDAPFEARLGLGAEYRFSRLLTVSALATVGVGGFGLAERVSPKDELTPLTGGLDEGDGHAWATLNIGSHFDLLPSVK
ncbi:MAG TPA: hypothetical protein VJN18_06615 [Polyangiaceae bacterium]|nr:hypothetical protein [Polyangiaceae bacterium]